MIKFYNTLSGSLEPFTPIRPGLVGLYTCGPTVYDYPHIGNWRAYVFEDLLKRFLTFSGYKVTHVMNLTDVDDKTIRGANALGVKLEQYTAKYIEAFFRDLRTLNIVPADVYPRATEHIPEMVTLIKVLLDKGIAYRKEGSIYFSIDKFPEYGRLSKINLEDRRPGSRGDADEYEKESVHDFALWKAPKEGEPSWETEIGPGRPGWHIECSAMSSKYLGPTFDIHCGGVDNIFPHHENEIAQSEAANGVKFVNYWLHCHHLVVDGEKMSKSKGNFHTLNDVLAKGYDPFDIRYLLISTHYRKMLNFTFEGLEQAGTARARITKFFGELSAVKRTNDGSADVRALVDKARLDFTAGLEDDLNISEALASIFSLIRAVNPLLAESGISASQARLAADFVSWTDPVLGLGLTPGCQAIDEAGPAEEWPAESEILALIEARRKARADKRWDLADSIRRELLENGVAIEDTRDGVRWKRVRREA